MIIESACQKRQCVHYLRVKQDNNAENTERHTCLAFPDRIPESIAIGENLHNKPYKGDNGIRYNGPDIKGESLK